MSTCAWVSVVSEVQNGPTFDRSGRTKMLRFSSRRPVEISSGVSPISMMSLASPFGGNPPSQHVDSMSMTMTWSSRFAMCGSCDMVRARHR